MDPLIELLRHRPLPELASALRARSATITRLWAEAVRHAISRMEGKSFDQLKDSLPAIIEAMAEAVSATDDDEMAALVRQSPVQGLTRFHQDYSVTEILQEDRLLRGIVVTEAEGHLHRQMRVAEAAALHAVIDVMLQRAVVALVEEQQARLRAAAETELKYLSFLSHDLRNNLNGVLLALQLATDQLRAAAGDHSDVAETLGAARESVADTVGGMQQLLEHERLRREGRTDRGVEPVDLHALAAALARRFDRDRHAKPLTLAVDVPPGVTLASNRELLTLVLQNLLGNAVKYTPGGGTVRLGAGRRTDGHGAGRWAVWVADTGPGIAPERRATLFDAFRRGEAHGQAGVGLGLTIAAQAATLLGAELTVDSELGVGSTFTLTLPATSTRSGAAAHAPAPVVQTGAAQ